MKKNIPEGYKQEALAILAEFDRLEFTGNPAPEIQLQRCIAEIEIHERCLALLEKSGARTLQELLERGSGE